MSLRRLSVVTLGALCLSSSTLAGTLEVVMFEDGANIRVEWFGQLDDLTNLGPATQQEFAVNEATSNFASWFFTGTSPSVNTYMSSSAIDFLVDFNPPFLQSSDCTLPGGCEWSRTADTLADDENFSVGITNAEIVILPTNFVTGQPVPPSGTTIPNQSFVTFGVLDTVTTTISWPSNDGTFRDTIRLRTERDFVLTAAPSVSSAPSSEPSLMPSASFTPSFEPTSIPTLSMSPTSQPSSLPSVSTTPSISAVPSSEPTEAPSVSQAPSSDPTSEPSLSISPSLEPTMVPSVSSNPSSEPTHTPSVSLTPSSVPTALPSASSAPSSVPTATPSLSLVPSVEPTNIPSISFVPTLVPSVEPTNLPTISFAPSLVPTALPTLSLAPSFEPTALPSVSSAPSSEPTATPSSTPSTSLPPSSEPTALPSFSLVPSIEPTSVPSMSSVPSSDPTASPTESIAPSSEPTNTPSVSLKPSSMPTSLPSVSSVPSLDPTATPSVSSLPSVFPSTLPSKQPTNYPTSEPSDQPVFDFPTKHPVAAELCPGKQVLCHAKTGKSKGQANTDMTKDGKGTKGSKGHSEKESDGKGSGKFHRNLQSTNGMSRIARYDKGKSSGKGDTKGSKGSQIAGKDNDEVLIAICVMGLPKSKSTTYCVHPMDDLTGIEYTCGPC